MYGVKGARLPVRRRASSIAFPGLVTRDTRTQQTPGFLFRFVKRHPPAGEPRRAAFVALSAALWSLGLPAVEFADDKAMTDHDSAVAPALISPHRDVEPFAQLLATRIEHARKPAT